MAHTFKAQQAIGHSCWLPCASQQQQVLAPKLDHLHQFILRLLVLSSKTIQLDLVELQELVSIKHVLLWLFSFALICGFTILISANATGCITADNYPL